MLSIDFPLSMENQWKNEPLPSPPFLPPPPSPPPPFPTVYCRERSRTEIFAKSGAPWNLRGLWGRSRGLGADHGDYGADHGDYGAEALPPDRQWSKQPPFPLSKIDQWAILLRGNAAITFAITFFPSRFLRPGRSSCFAPHRHTRTVDH